MISELEAIFSENRSSKISAGQSTYMKNHFPFFGIQKPQRAQLQHIIFAKYPVNSETVLISILEDLWQKDEREFQYAACDLAIRYSKLWSQNSMKCFEKMIRSKSWWDTVDQISSNLIGSLLLRYPKFILQINCWVLDSCLWIRRASLPTLSSYTILSSNLSNSSPKLAKLRQ